MYVCLCNGHTSHQLETLAQSGVECVEQAYELLGGKPDCRRCIAYAKTVMADAARGTAQAVTDRCHGRPGPVDSQEAALSA